MGISVTPGGWGQNLPKITFFMYVRPMILYLLIHGINTLLIQPAIYIRLLINLFYFCFILELGIGYIMPNKLSNSKLSPEIFCNNSFSKYLNE